MDAMTRTVAGRYRLLDRLGAGAMGTVWRAEDLSLGRTVAVKEVTFPPGVGEPEREVLRERTRREARMAAGLDHPSAVTVYDVVEEGGATYVVMELVPSRTLAEVIRADGPLSPRRAAEVGLGVLGALSAAHARGIVHRDVKPGNVLVRDDGRVVLTDFGISTATGDPSLTTTGVLVGSPAYMSPERARGRVPGPASDLWSLGATLYAAVEGRAPFDRGEALPTLSAVLSEPHEPFVRSGALAPVLDALLEKDPGRRMDAVQARAELARVLDAPDGSAPSVSPARGPDPRAVRTTAVPMREVHERVQRDRARRSRTPLVIGGLVLVSALVGGLFVLSGAGTTGPGNRPTAVHTAGTQSSAAAPPNTSAGAVVVPAGWTTYTAGQGWSVAHPKTWAVGTFRQQVQLRDPVSGRTLRVDTTASPRSDPVEDWRQQAKGFAAAHRGYGEIGIGKASYRGYDTADWEFTYTDGGSALHALDRGFVVNDHRAYALFWQTRAADWQAARPVFDQIAASFVPG